MKTLLLLAMPDDFVIHSLEIAFGALLVLGLFCLITVALEFVALRKRVAELEKHEL